MQVLPIPRATRRLAVLVATVFCLTAPRLIAASPSAEEIELTFNRGIVLYEQGNFEAALALFQQAAPHHEVASKYEQLCVEELVDVEPVGFHSQSCGCDGGCDSMTCGCSSRAACVPEPRRWNLTFLTGYQYDSNVTLSPEFVGLGSGQGIEDSSWLIVGFGDYRLVQCDRWNVGVIGSVFANQYFEANEFDSHDFMGGGYTNLLLRPWLMAGIRYEFHETLLDYSSFASQHRLVPNISMLQGDFGHLTGYYEYERQDFDFAPLIPAMNRSGNTNSFGVTQAIYTWEGAGRIYVGYRYDRAETEGTDFDRKTSMVTGRLECPLTPRVIWDLEYRHFWDDYDNPNSLDFAGRPRDDERAEVRTGLQFVVGPHVSIRTDYTYIDSSSNTENLFGVRFFDCDRHLFSTQFIYDF